MAESILPSIILAIELIKLEVVLGKLRASASELAVLSANLVVTVVNLLVTVANLPVRGVVIMLIVPINVITAGDNPIAAPFI